MDFTANWDYMGTCDFITVIVETEHCKGIIYNNVHCAFRVS